MYSVIQPLIEKEQAVLKKVIWDESGRVLAWALVVLAIGVLLIPPLLAYISTNLLASRTVEEGLKEQYAADSGVEYAMLQIQNGITTGQNSYAINSKQVDVTWGEFITATYKITSTATSLFDGSSCMHAISLIKTASDHMC